MGTATWGMLFLASGMALVVIGVPGTLIGVALRLRGLWLTAASPLLGVSAIAMASLWTPLVGFTWNWAAVALTASALAALGAVVAAFTPKVRFPKRGGRSGSLAALSAVGIGVLLLSVRFAVAIGRPDWFDQAGDNVFHLNVVRWILDNGDASAFDIMNLDGKASASYYPDAWHATVALVCQMTGAPITVASNAVLFVIACIVWPLGGVLLTRTVFGASTALLISAGAISAGFSAYPLVLIPYMGTYPLVLGIALIPSALAACAAALGLAALSIPRLIAVALLALVLPGIALAHPSALIMLAALVVPLVWGAMWRLGRANPERRTLALLVGLLAAVISLALIIYVRPPFTQSNSLRSTVAQALGEVLTGTSFRGPIPIVLATLAIIGTVVSLRRGGVTGWVAVGVWAMVSGIYIAAADNDEFIRLVFSGPWYADATRVAAFTPIAILPLGARGAEWVWSWLGAHVDFPAYPTRRRVAEITAILLLGALMVQSTAAQRVTRFMNAMFTPTANILASTVPVSADDRALIAKIPNEVPGDAVIAGDPWTGAGFVYALTGRRALVSHMLAPVTGETKVLLDGISNSTADGPACRASARLGVDWVIELHGGKTLPNRPQYAGLKHLSSSKNLKLIDRVGKSSLYKIVGCEAG